MSGKTVRLSKKRLFAKLGYQPHPGQVEVHKSPAPRRIVACGVRWGKTLCAAMEGIAAALEPRDRSVGWVVAPTYDLADRVFREIQLVIVTHLRHRIVTMREHDRKIVIRNLGGGLSEIRAKSADNPTSLLGEGLDWLIVDEASRLKPTIWQSHLSQRMIDKKGWALLISTPKGKGYFFELHQRGQGRDADYQSWNYASWTNPLLDREIIEAERSRLPERVFAQEYGAEFTEGSGSVFRNIRERAIGELQEPMPGEKYHGGLDLAKVEDFTVLVIMNKRGEVVAYDRFHRQDWSIQVGRIRAVTEKYNNATILVDSTGAGEPVLENLRKENIKCLPYTFTLKTKSALIDNLALLLEKCAITLPRAEVWFDLVDEMENYQFSVSDAGNVKMNAPYGTHDDCVIGLALAAWNLRPRCRVRELIAAPRAFGPYGRIYPRGHPHRESSG